MLDSFPFAIMAGIVLGYLAGLGVGGGSLLMLWLTLILHLPHQTAKMINLMFFITAAGAVSLFRWKQGSLPLKKILPAMIAGSIAAGLFSWLGMYLDTALIKKLFGFLLLFTGIRELFYRPRNCK